MVSMEDRVPVFARQLRPALRRNGARRCARRRSTGRPVLRERGLRGLHLGGGGQRGAPRGNESGEGVGSGALEEVMDDEY